MRTKRPTARFFAGLALLCCCLLTCCGTRFHHIPYNVGVKHPYVEGKHIISDGDTVPSEEFELREERLADRTQRCKVAGLEVYRIGADYYVKQEVVYTPVSKHSYIWDVTKSARRDFPVDDASKQEKETYYFRVNERWTQNNAWMETAGLPRLKRPDGQPAGKDILTEKQALAINPEFVKVVKVCANDEGNANQAWRERNEYADVVHDSARRLTPRYSWTHYAMLPVSTATFLFVDFPCDIVGSIGGGFVYGVMYLCLICGGDGL